MSEETTGVSEDAIRARRFEVVDEAGHVRAVFGMLPALPPVGESAGFEIRHPSGAVSATCAVAEAEAWLSLQLDGNAVVHVGVVGSGDPDGPQAVLTVCDADGAPVAGWRVTEGALHTVDD
ncbi:MAG TPA: hypothetical protein VM618_08730 [Acidimicrobiia bacterium]|nr:hypothetical protein [Acidimicrobiia bacterium]